MRTELAGSQFTIQAEMENTEYKDYEQIVAVVFNSNNLTNAITFVKVADVNYPDAELIQQTDANKKVIDFFFSKDKTALMLGTYGIEIMRIVGGVKMPILKYADEVLTIKKSRICQ
jgi:hypothetical protein